MESSPGTAAVAALLWKSSTGACGCQKFSHGAGSREKILECLIKHVEGASNNLASSLESSKPMALKGVVLFGFARIPLALP